MCAKFGVYLINISKVTSCKTKWPRFGVPGRYRETLDLKIWGLAIFLIFPSLSPIL